MKITAVIITKNEEPNIGRCLDSLQDVADEIIVVDALSTDKTEAICWQYPNMVFVSREWAGYAASKNHGNSLAQHPYILSIDADEVLSENLRLEIQAEKLSLRGTSPTARNEVELRGVYSMPRLNHIGQKPIRFSGWYPDRKIRLFPKAKTQWTGDFVHERLEFQGEVKPFKSNLLHYTYSSFTQYDNKMRNYGTLGAKDMFSKGKHLSWGFMVLKVFFKFFSVYVLKLGVLDGLEGLNIAYESAKTIYWKYAVLQELYKNKAMNDNEVAQNSTSKS